mmetsp:Transcript_5566/g.19566  ORF Transcript_5566/g.19566 Transcript_5566/m.19566 type:complete len:210 (+) Transcript_5566:1218-1847(+)
MIYIHMLKHLLVKGVLFLYLIAFFQRSRRFVFRSADDVRWWASCHGSQALLQLYYSSLNIRAVLLLQPLSQLLWGFRQCFHCFLLCYLQEPRSGFMPHQLGNVHGTVTLRCCAVKRYPSSQQHLNCLVLPVPCRLMQGCHSSRIHQFFVQLLVFKQESKHLESLCWSTSSHQRRCSPLAVAAATNPCELSFLTSDIPNLLMSDPSFRAS